jgi:hypothetical protein
MKELIAFILPPATALAGMRMSRWVLGPKFENDFGPGFQFAFGLGTGMLVFSQAVILFALLGFNAAYLLAWSALAWGAVELVLLAMKLPAMWKSVKFQPGHLWLLLLVPTLYFCWVMGRLSTLEGTMEFDANAFWVFKAKIFFLDQGKALINLLHEPNLAYGHANYPTLVPCLYTLDYGAVGAVDEFVNKVWPFWMVAALCVGILSLGEILQRPRLLPIAIVTLICFLPGTIKYVRWEGGTMPMVFYTTLATITIARILLSNDSSTLALCVLPLTGSIMAKFEGAVYAGLWFGVLFVFYWRRGWLKAFLNWKAALAALVCLLPFVIFRLAKPLSHPDDLWSHELLTSPATVLRNFPWVLYLSVIGTFFSPDFFKWSPDNQIHWSGHWAGWGSFVNDQTSILSWLLIFLLGISLWKKNGRVTAALLAAVVIADLAVLSLVMGSLPISQNNNGEIVAISGQAVRYYYPYLIALFLGLMQIWLMDRSIPVQFMQNPGAAQTTPRKDIR